MTSAALVASRTTSSGIVPQREALAVQKEDLARLELMVTLKETHDFTSVIEKSTQGIDKKSYSKLNRDGMPPTWLMQECSKPLLGTPDTGFPGQLHQRRLTPSTCTIARCDCTVLAGYYYWCRVNRRHQGQNILQGSYGAVVGGEEETCRANRIYSRRPAAVNLLLFEMLLKLGQFGALQSMTVHVMTSRSCFAEGRRCSASDHYMKFIADAASHWLVYPRFQTLNETLIMLSLSIFLTTDL